MKAAFKFEVDEDVERVLKMKKRLEIMRKTKEFDLKFKKMTVFFYN